MRDQKIDIAKGLGIFLVVWGHNLNPGYAGTIIYSFHMPLFFMLSGVYHKQTSSIITVVRSKSKSLLLPFLFFSIFSYVFYLIWALLFNGINTLDFWKIIKLIPVKDAISVPLWFFISLFEIVLLYHVLRSKNQSSLILLGITFLISVFSFIISKLDLTFFYNYFHIFSSFSMLIFYSIGAELFKRYRYKIIPARSKKLLSLLLSLLLLYYFNTFSNGTDINGNILGLPFLVYFLTAITGIYSIWLISNLKQISYISNFWSYVGQNSLGIFAIHMCMFEFARPLVKVFIAPGSYLSNFIVSIFTLGITIVFNEIFKFIFPFVYGKQQKRKLPIMAQSSKL